MHGTTGIYLPSHAYRTGAVPTANSSAVILPAAAWRGTAGPWPLACGCWELRGPVRVQHHRYHGGPALDAVIGSFGSVCRHAQWFSRG
jgi:hypothetical protein